MTIFHKIINKEVPANIIYEDEFVMAILDVFPATYGHTLVLPKTYSKNVLEMSQESFALLMIKTQQIANEIMKKLDAKGCNIVMNTNPAAEQSIPYTHIHIIPRYESDYQLYNPQHEVENVDYSELVEKLKIIL